MWDLRTGAVAVAFTSGQPVWCFDAIRSSQSAVDGDAPIGLGGGSLVVSGHEDGIVRRWDARRPVVSVSCWSGHGGSPVTSLCSVGDKVVTGCTAGGVRLWDAQTGLSLLCEGHTGQVAATAVADDYLLSASWDGGLSCWFPAT